MSSSTHLHIIVIITKWIVERRNHSVTFNKPFSTLLSLLIQFTIKVAKETAGGKSEQYSAAHVGAKTEKKMKKVRGIGVIIKTCAGISGYIRQTVVYVNRQS